MRVVLVGELFGSVERLCETEFFPGCQVELNPFESVLCHFLSRARDFVPNQELDVNVAKHRRPQLQVHHATLNRFGRKPHHLGVTARNVHIRHFLGGLHQKLGRKGLTHH